MLRCPFCCISVFEWTHVTSSYFESSDDSHREIEILKVTSRDLADRENRYTLPTSLSFSFYRSFISLFINPTFSLSLSHTHAISNINILRRTHMHTHSSTHIRIYAYTFIYIYTLTHRVLREAKASVDLELDQLKRRVESLTETNVLLTREHSSQQTDKNKTISGPFSYFSFTLSYFPQLFSSTFNASNFLIVTTVLSFFFQSFSYFSFTRLPLASIPHFISLKLYFYCRIGNLLSFLS